MTDGRRPVPVAAIAGGLFCVLVIYLALQVRAGNDPAIGTGNQAAAVQRPRPVIVRRVIVRRIVEEEPAAAGSAAASSGAAATTAAGGSAAPAPAAPAAAPAPAAPAPAPVVSSGS